MHAEFWQARWARSEIGFHLPEVNPYLQQYWPALGLPEGARVLVPLCGKSLDLVWLVEQGHAVIGVELAERAVQEDDEIPVGAVLVSAEGEVLGEGWNRNIREHDPTAHAEIVAMREAGRKLGNHRLLGCTLYVTLEPCAMCAMAMVHARVARVVFGARDPKTGAAGSVFNLLTDSRHNHRLQAEGGVLAEEAGSRLTEYFRRKRARPGL